MPKFMGAALIGALYHKQVWNKYSFPREFYEHTVSELQNQQCNVVTKGFSYTLS